MTVIAVGFFTAFAIAFAVATTLAGIEGFAIVACIFAILLMVGTDDGGTGPF